MPKARQMIGGPAGDDSRIADTPSNQRHHFRRRQDPPGGGFCIEWRTRRAGNG